MRPLDDLQYVYREIRENYADRFWWRDRVLHRIIAPFHLSIYPTRAGSIQVNSEDFDTLVVLDACRADLFEERADIGSFNEYNVVQSPASATQEWVQQNISGGSFGDTIYVTANPFVSREASGAFHAIYEPWLTDFDEELRTVPPERTTKVAIEAHQEYPKKRLIVHYMQPHHPFVKAPELQFHGWQIDDFEGWTEHQQETGLDKATARGRPHTPWDALYMGHVSKAEVWEAYGDNLDIVLGAVMDLMEAVDGRTVVTSDHGNMIGERTYPVPMRVYGHPKGIRNQQLVNVPWAVIEGDERREIESEGTGSGVENDREIIQDRLEDLGYM